MEESKYVKNEFSLGGFCDEAYQRVYNANRRLCERLGVEEDKDVESIITDLLDIGEYLALKMFDYGCFFSASSVYASKKNGRSKIFREDNKTVIFPESFL